jgi:hypothetical protein
MTRREIIVSAIATAQTGTVILVAVRVLVFIGTVSVRDDLRAVKCERSRQERRVPDFSLAPPLYLPHPSMQPKVIRLVASRAHSIDFSLKAIFLVARIQTR